jgi:hypothetical protein
MGENKLKKKIIKKFEGELEEALLQYEFWRVKCSTLGKLIEDLKGEADEITDAD